MKRQFLYMIAVVLTLLVLTACDVNENARVHIEYEQLANFYTYALSPGSSSTTSAGEGMFILYKINKITNTGSEAKSFIFDGQNISSVTSEETSNAEPSGENILLGSKLVANLTVSPGQTVNNPGCIIKHALISDPQSLFNTSALVGLIHSSTSSQPVSMKRATGDSTTALIDIALPSGIQNLCN